MWHIHHTRLGFRSPLVVFSLVTTAALVACAPPAAESDPEPRPVRSEVMTAQALEITDRYAGAVQSRYETPLAFRVGGKISERLVEVGSQVAAGEVLMRLDPQDLKLGEQSLRAQLDAAQADLARARSELDRYRDLLGKRLVSQSEFDQRKNAFDTAQARVEQTQAQLEERIRQAGYSELIADQTGLITEMQVEVGQVVTAGQPVLKLALPQEKEIAIDVPENRLGDFQVKQPVAITLWALPEARYRGQVREIAPVADPVTRTFAVKVTVLDPDPAMQLGMTASVILRQTIAEAGIRLPLSALFEDNGRPGVWVVDPETLTVALLPVTLGAFLDNQVAIESGLQEGQRVVTAGAHKLYQGQRVRLLEDAR